MNYTTEYNSPLGVLTLISDGESLTGLWFEGQINDAANGTHNDDTLPVFHLVKDWLYHYFAGDNPPINTLPLAPQGSSFQRTVWDILITIPYGEVTTYGDIAKEIGKRRGIAKMSAQAVGNAVGRNPLGIIIPCHRVIGKCGNLTGYGGGIPLKIKLLEREGIDVSGMYVPKKGALL